MARKKKTAKRNVRRDSGDKDKEGAREVKPEATKNLVEEATIDPADAPGREEEEEDGDADVIWVPPPPSRSSKRRKNTGGDPEVEWELVSSRPIKSLEEIKASKSLEEIKASTRSTRKRTVTAVAV